MPVLLIVALGVILWMFVTYKARHRTRHCRWREDRSRDTAEGRYFICVSCGAETFISDMQPPRICLKPERRE